MKGTGKFRCGNCRWFTEPRTWGKGEAPQDCRQRFLVSEDQSPCAAKKRGYGEFDPIDMGQRAETIEKLINSMNSDDLVMVRILADRRENQILREGVSQFRIGDRVQFAVGDEDVEAEVVGVTRKYVVTEDVTGKQRKLLPGTLRLL